MFGALAMPLLPAGRPAVLLSASELSQSARGGMTRC